MQLLTMDSRAAVLPGRLPAAPVPFFRTAIPRPTTPTQAPVAPVTPRAQAEACSLPRDVASRFGRRIRELRHAKGMTQMQVAVHFGIDRTFISDVERGRKSVCLPTLEVFALGFGVSLSDLLRGI